MPSLGERKIAAVGFDLGETLLTYADTPLNWTALYPQALAHVAQHCALPLGPDETRAAEEILKRYNTRLHPRTKETTAQIIFAEIVSRWPVAAADRSDEIIAAFFAFFQQRVVTYSDTVPTLTALRTQGVPVGMLTDAPYGMPRDFVQRDLAAVAIAGLLDTWLTSVDVGWRKPEPVGFRALASSLGTTVEQLCFIGNEEKDVRGALAAGAIAVLVDRERKRPDWGQHHTIRDLSELPALL
jgi:putative hydrolase of the HAD superfamily